jgi:hypothetical protein
MLNKTKRRKTLKAIKDYFKQMGGKAENIKWNTHKAIICYAPMPNKTGTELFCICKLSLDMEGVFIKLNLADNWCFSKKEDETVITTASPEGKKCIFWDGLRTYTGTSLEDTDLILQKIREAITYRKSFITVEKKIQIEKDFEDGCIGT